MRVNRAFIILMFFLALSCNKNKHNTIAIAPSHNSSKELNNILGVLNSTDTLSNYIWSLKLDLAHIEHELEMVYLRDQQYRDSLNNPLQKGNKGCFISLMTKYDKVNQRIVNYILQSKGWLKNMSSTANNGIYYTIHHSSDSIFLYNSLIHIEEAFKEQIISPQEFARIIDVIKVRTGSKQIYGAYPYSRLDKEGNKIFPPSISLSLEKMNSNRLSIGLDSIKVNL